MTFLDPRAGLIGAAIAVPLLIAMYLLKLRRKPLRVSSTLLWEQAIKDVQANVPFKRLRWSWLLLLQLLALAGLLIALARPAIPGIAGWGERTIIVIDHSASMSCEDAAINGAVTPDRPATGISRLDTAKARARQIVQELRRSTSGGVTPEAMVIALASDATSLTPFTSSSRTLTEAIDSIEPTDQPAKLGPLVELIRAIALPVAGEHADAATETRLLVVSDGGIEAPADRALAPFPPGVNARLVPIADAVSPTHRDHNFGIVALAARRDPLSPTTVRVFVKVAATPSPSAASNTDNGTGARTAVLSFRLNDLPVGSIELPIPPAPPLTSDPNSALDEASATFEITLSDNAPNSGGGLLSVMLSRPDLLSADNAASLIIPALRPASVLAIGPGGIASGTGSPTNAEHGIDMFLLEAIRAAQPRSLRTISIAQYEALASQSPLEPMLADADVLFFDRCIPTSPPARASVHIGAGVPTGGAASGVSVVPFTPDAPEYTPTRVVLWKRDHPLLRGIPLDAILVSPPMRLLLPDRLAPGAAVILAEGVRTPLMAIVQDDLPGRTPRRLPRLILAFDLARSNWAGDVSFPVFVASAIEVMGSGFAVAPNDTPDSARHSDGVMSRTDQSVRLIPASPTSDITFQGPISRTLVAPPGGWSRDAAERAALPPLPRVGVYTSNATDPRTGRSVVCVNLLSDIETDTRPRQAISLGEGASPLEATRRHRAPPGSEMPKREIWWIFVLASIVLLWAEWFVFARQMKA